MPLFDRRVRGEEHPDAVPGEFRIVGAVGTGGSNGYFHRNDLTRKRLVDFAGIFHCKLSSMRRHSSISRNAWMTNSGWPSSSR